MERYLLIFVQIMLIVDMYIQSFVIYPYAWHRCAGNYPMSEIQALQNFHRIGAMLCGASLTSGVIST